CAREVVSYAMDYW
nr:immunoglobulin heavy chain junction region [Mus musculus]MBK4197722.1 immunoglobulin heavy chain junction region [Mus musculus]MBK4197723.1 immunoglobulin heavy chain junction region [Mus musculus]